MLVDFGLVRRINEERRGYGHRRIMGTVDLHRPRTGAGGKIDARTDIYSLGCSSTTFSPGVCPFPPRALRR